MSHGHQSTNLYCYHLNSEQIYVFQSVTLSRESCHSQVHNEFVSDKISHIEHVCPPEADRKLRSECFTACIG